jgi:type I restriction enzyme, R subunit
LEKVRENTSIDWAIKESVKAKLKVIVKRILRPYGLPAGHADAGNRDGVETSGIDCGGDHCW